jgi:hypothetical protein
MLSFRFQVAALIAALLAMAASALVISSSCGAGPTTADEKQIEAWWVDL